MTESITANKLFEMRVKSERQSLIYSAYESRNYFFVIKENLAFRSNFLF